MQHDKDTLKALLFEKISGTISDEDNQWIEERIAQSDEVRNEWERILKYYGHNGNKQFLAKLDEQKAWENINKQLSEDKQHQENNPTPRKIGYRIPLVAATLGLLAIATWLYLTTNRSAKDLASTVKPSGVYLLNEQNTISLEGSDSVHISELIQRHVLNDHWNTVVVPAKFDYKLILPDGTQVWLNSMSQLRFPKEFAAGDRRVFLDGEAYFEVAKDKSKPFYVQTAYATVEVLGTSFNVRAYAAEGYTASLVEGAVRNELSGQHIDLVPGQQVVYKNGEISVQSFDREVVCGWTTGRYSFNDRHLAEIVPVMERWFDVEIEIENKQLLNERFTGAIVRGQSLSDCLELLAISGTIESKIEGRKVYLK